MSINPFRESYQAWTQPSQQVGVRPLLSVGTTTWDSLSPFADQARQSQVPNALNQMGDSSPSRRRGSEILRAPSLLANSSTPSVTSSMFSNAFPPLPFSAVKNPKRDLESTFTVLESCDESNVNRQAELSSRMQGVLLGSVRNSEKSRSSQIDTMDQTFDDFDQVMLDNMKENFDHPLDMPKRSDGWTVRHLLSVVEFCQHHAGEAPIHPVFVLRVLRDVAASMLPKAHNAVREMAVPKNGRCVIVGDTHGQLEDVLWIFHKNGLPSSTNAYIFNGDIADRGRNAIEIFIMVYVAMLIYPKQVGINRGNHEDETVNMDQHCGGFYAEIIDKYGSGVGGRLWIEIIKLYPLLPLATVLSSRIFIVHGGLSRQERMLPILKSITKRRVSLPEMPRSSTDIVYVDAMWSDPQDGQGIATSSRGQSLIQFGPDVTKRFLDENNFSMLVRSHQPPKNKDGVYFQHNCRLVTVFSASNYCGWYGNQGGVLIFSPDLSHNADRHFSPTFDTLSKVKISSDDAERFTPKRRHSNAAIEFQARRNSVTRDPQKTELQRNIQQRLARLIVESKDALWTYFLDADTSPPYGFIPLRDFRLCMNAVLYQAAHMWEEIGDIGEVDAASGQVDYRRFLNRFQCVIKGDANSGISNSWMDIVLGRLYERLMREDLGWSDLVRRFDSAGTGKVSVMDFRREVQEDFNDRDIAGGFLSEEQTTQLLRALSASSCTRSVQKDFANVDVADLLARLETLYTGYTRAVNGGDGNRTCPSALCAAVLRNIGRVLCYGYSDTHEAIQCLQKLFADADADLSGKLNIEEFRRAIEAILSAHPHIVQEIPGTNGVGHLEPELFDELFAFADLSGDRTINFLEFLHCFQPDKLVEGTCSSLRTCLMEQITTAIYMNKGALLKTFSYYDLDYTHKVDKEVFLRVIWSLNASLSSASPPLTLEQVDILVDHAKCDSDNRVNYVDFLNSFEIIDTQEIMDMSDDRMEPNRHSVTYT